MSRRLGGLAAAIMTSALLISGAVCAAPAFASKMPDETLPDGSHCDGKPFKGPNVFVTYSYVREYRNGNHRYQEYQGKSVFPNPQFGGDPNVDTWRATVRCS